MPVHNIVDKRSNKYLVNVMAIFESSENDDTIVGASQFGDYQGVNREEEECTYVGIAATTIDRAIRFAQIKWPTLPVTLYLYDVGTKNVADYAGLSEQLEPINLS
jgi:hypothetical protein